MWPEDLPKYGYEHMSTATKDLLSGPPAPVKESRTAFTEKLLSYIKAGDGIVITAHRDGISISLDVSRLMEEMERLTEQNHRLFGLLAYIIEDVKDLKEEVFDD